MPSKKNGSTKTENYTFLDTFTKTFLIMTFEQLKLEVNTIIENTGKTVDQRLFGDLPIA